MKYLFLGGLGSQSAAVAGALSRLNVDNYNVVIGNNTSALLVMSFALRHDMRQVIYASSFSKIGQSNPFTGGALLRLKTAFRIAKGAQGVHGNYPIRKAYSALITEKDFEEYREMYNEGIVPRVGVTFLNTSNKAVGIAYADQHSYSDWVDWVVASCSISGFIKSQRIFSHRFVSAVSRIDSAAMYVYAGNNPVNPNNITLITEVYGRPEWDFDQAFIALPIPKGIMSSIISSMIVSFYQLSAMNRFYTMTWCKHNKVPYKAYFPVNEITSDPFDFTKNSLFNQFAAGYSGAESV